MGNDHGLVEAVSLRQSTRPGLDDEGLFQGRIEAEVRRLAAMDT